MSEDSLPRVLRDITPRILLTWPFTLAGTERSRKNRMSLLLVLIGLALLATTLLARNYQAAFFKSFLVFFMAILPGWLYLYFTQSKGTALYDEYVLNLYRMQIDEVANLPKPPPGSAYWEEWDQVVGKAGDEQVARNIYLKKFEAVYGRSVVPNSRRKRSSDENSAGDLEKIVDHLKSDTFSPVGWCTVLLAVGWAAVLQPDLLRNFEPFGPIPEGAPPKVASEALRMGFIGSYVFILQSLVRRYFQFDLKAQAYVSAISRLILVSSLLLALGPWLEQKDRVMVAAISFAIGMFPELGFRVIKGLVASVGRVSDEERYPLTELDGINLWHRARFLEEGIEDMQNLTTASIVDLMLNTRMPVHRVIDWMDQSFLYLRVGGRRKDRGDRFKLRKLGIRTATDLLDLLEGDDKSDPTFRKRLLRVLNKRDDGSDDGGPSVIEGVRRSLACEVNLEHVIRWKKHVWLPEPRKARPSTMLATT